MYRRILVGCDTTHESLLAVYRAVEVAKSFACRLDVAIIDTTPRRCGEYVDDSQELMTWMVDLCAICDVTPIEHQAIGDPAVALMAIADQVGADLIVVSGADLGQRVQLVPTSRSTSPDVLVVAGIPAYCRSGG